MNVMDALYISMAKKQKVDLKFMSELTGVSVAELKIELVGKLIVQEPWYYDANQDKDEDYVLIKNYLEGNKIKLLREAEEMHEKCGRFAENIRILKDCIRKIPSIEEMDITMGAKIPPYFYGKFFKHYLKMQVAPKVKHKQSGNFWARWEISGGVMGSESNKLNTVTNGTVKVPALMVGYHTLNGTTPDITKTELDLHGNEVATADVKEMLAFHVNQTNMIKAFKEFIRTDEEARERIPVAIQETLRYTEDNLEWGRPELPDKNPKVIFRDDQLAAVARILSSKTTLLAKGTGAGKTYIASAGIHEKQRLGLAGKTLYITSDELVMGQTVETHRNIYPQDKLLVISQKDFHENNRSKMLEEIKFGDYDIVHMTSSSFDILDVSRKCYLEENKKEIQECRAAISMAAGRRDKSALEESLKKLRKKREELLAAEDKEEACFEDLGFTMLVIDEAHNYRNLTIKSRIKNIVGMHSKGPAKCSKALQKVRHIQKQGGDILFMTATIFYNSFADGYSMMRYLQQEELEMCGIARFDDWVSTFCEQETDVENSLDPRKARFVTRFSRLINVEQLIAMLSQVAIFDGEEVRKLKLPEFQGYTEILVPISQKQKKYMDEEIITRLDKIRNGEVTNEEDNLLKILSDILLCALDERHMFPDAAVESETSKIAVCANKVYEMYKKYPDYTQMILCNRSTPKDAFNVYDEMKKQLQNLGIPAEEIRFIHEARSAQEKLEMAKTFNEGKIKVLMGSRRKLGVGVNVQKKFVAMHHLDAPWNPGELIQSEGRIKRAENECESIFIFCYLKELMEVYLWQHLLNKQKINTALDMGRIKAINQSVEDAFKPLLSMAEFVAMVMGDGRLKGRMEISNQILRLQIDHAKRVKELQEVQRILGEIPEKLIEKRVNLKSLSTDISWFQAKKETVDASEQKDFDEALKEALEENVMNSKFRIFDVYQGFKVILPKEMKADKVYIRILGAGGNAYSLKQGESDGFSWSKKIAWFLECRLPEKKQELEKEIEGMEKQLKEAESEQKKGNPYTAQIQELTRQIEELDAKLLERTE